MCYPGRELRMVLNMVSSDLHQPEELVHVELVVGELCMSSAIRMMTLHSLIFVV